MVAGATCRGGKRLRSSDRLRRARREYAEVADDPANRSRFPRPARRVDRPHQGGALMATKKKQGKAPRDVNAYSAARFIFRNTRWISCRSRCDGITFPP